MPNIRDNATIAFYDLHAENYFNSTVGVDMSECCDRFLRYLAPGDNIIDVGAGSGRDMHYFLSRGYKVDGIDASSELCKLASEYTGVAIECQTIQNWKPRCTYKGIWANASLVHLSIPEIESFFAQLPVCLSEGGVAYISFKSSITTGVDCLGRYFTNMTNEKLRQIIERNPAIRIVEIWDTEDNLNRNNIKWINVIVQKKY
jgi:2-polyprenyl-3-methyl-5-hydroxy-6-metoxy-1,4-benzoquinol methylase